MKKKTSRDMTPKEYETEHYKLRQAVKQAQQDLWDFCNPVIVDPQVAAHEEAWRSKQKSMKKESPKKDAPKASPFPPTSWGSDKK